MPAFTQRQRQLIRYAQDLRQRPTIAEMLLWDWLQSLDGFRFGFQIPKGQYILDFYCPAQKLVIELDGNSHDGRETYDRDRDRILRQTYGLRILRFQNAVYTKHRDKVHNRILHAINAPKNAELEHTIKSDDAGRYVRLTPKQLRKYLTRCAE